jgi:hypothetical protein
MVWFRAPQDVFEAGAMPGNVVQEFRVIAFLEYQQSGHLRDDRREIAGDLLQGYDRDVSPARQGRAIDEVRVGFQPYMGFDVMTQRGVRVVEYSPAF